MVLSNKHLPGVAQFIPDVWLLNQNVRIEAAKAGV
jgi:hypothetical protein